MTTDVLEPIERSTQRSASVFERWGRRVFLSLVHEPLAHFFFLGALIFIGNAILTPAVPPNKRIDVTSSLRKTIADTFVRERGRTPTSEEMNDLLNTWVLNEITYREALAQGFDKGDDMIRDRLMQKMSLLIFSNVTVQEPTAADLEKWLDTHRERYDVPQRVSFFEVLIGDSEADADAALKEINEGREPESLRLRAHSFADRPLNSLIGAFSQKFIDALVTLPMHHWQKLQSTDGWHIVRVEATVPVRRVDVAEVRDPLTQDWKQAQARARAVATVRKMGKDYVISGVALP